ncbi:MAG: hypothetical protein ACPGR5_07330 [Chitinophagales bacterium]
MKQKISILVLMLAFAFGATAQTIGDFIDVLYLKNGSKIKGIIVEQVPGKTVKIQTKDGSQYVYKVTEVEKFTREEAIVEAKSSNTTKPDSLKYMNNYKAKKKGYFVNIDALFNSAGSGLRITNGYRFGRFGNLGLAVGLETINLNYYYNHSFPALSLNLVYSGEILKKRITPFYQIEAGYGFSMDRSGYGAFDGVYAEDYDFYGYEERTNYGGPMGAIAFGVKFHTKKKISYKLSLDAKINSNFSDVTSYYPYDPLSSFVESYTYKDFSARPGLGIRFGIGF